MHNSSNKPTKRTGSNANQPTTPPYRIPASAGMTVVQR